MFSTVLFQNLQFTFIEFGRYDNLECDWKMLFSRVTSRSALQFLSINTSSYWGSFEIRN